MSDEKSKFTSPSDDPIAVIDGCIRLKCKRKNGNEVEVKVREVPMRHMQDYAGSIGEPAKCLDLLTGDPELSEDGPDGLDNDSFLKVLERGQALNAPFVNRYLKLMNKTAKSMGIDVEETQARITGTVKQ